MSRKKYWIIASLCIVTVIFIYSKNSFIQSSSNELNSKNKTSKESLPAKKIQHADIGLELIESPEGAYIFTGSGIDRHGNIFIFGSNREYSFVRTLTSTDAQAYREIRLPAVPLEVQMSDQLFLRSIDSVFFCDQNGIVISRNKLPIAKSPIERTLILREDSLAFILANGKTLLSDGILLNGWLQNDRSLVQVNAIFDKSRHSAIINRIIGSINQQYVLNSDLRIGTVYNWGTVSGYVIFTVEKIKTQSPLTVISELLIFASDNLEQGPVARTDIQIEPRFFIKNWIILSDKSINVFLTESESLRPVIIETDSVSVSGYLTRAFR